MSNSKSSLKPLFPNIRLAWKKHNGHKRSSLLSASATEKNVSWQVHLFYGKLVDRFLVRRLRAVGDNFFNDFFVNFDVTVNVINYLLPNLIKRFFGL